MLDFPSLPIFTSKVNQFLIEISIIIKNLYLWLIKKLKTC